MKVSTQIGPFAIMPLWLMRACVDAEALRIYAWLSARYANEDRQAWPSQKRLGVDLGLSVDTVQRKIQVLRECGALKTIRQPIRGGGSKQFHYELVQVENRNDAVFEAVESRTSAVSKAANDHEKSPRTFISEPDPDQPKRGRVFTGGYKGTETYKDRHLNCAFCGIYFGCVSQEQHFRFQQRIKAQLDEDPEDWDLLNWYKERDAEWGEVPLERRDRKGPMYWLAVRLGDELVPTRERA